MLWSACALLGLFLISSKLTGPGAVVLDGDVERRCRAREGVHRYGVDGAGGWVDGTNVVVGVVGGREVVMSMALTRRRQQGGVDIPFLAGAGFGQGLARRGVWGGHGGQVRLHRPLVQRYGAVLLRRGDGVSGAGLAGLTGRSDELEEEVGEGDRRVSQLDVANVDVEAEEPEVDMRLPAEVVGTHTH